MILQSLRQATTERRQFLESGVPVARFIKDPLQYINLLTGLYGFFSVMEPELLQWSGYFGSHRLTKTDWLCDDLLDLGVCGSDLISLATFPGPLELSTPAEALGCMYVIENETQGGRFVRDYIRNSGLGMPCRYFDGYGERGREEWLAFLNNLEEYSSLHSEDQRIIRAAVETYTRLGNWLRAERPVPV